MKEETWKRYKIKDLEDKVHEIMKAADAGNDRKYGHLGAELIHDISDKIDEVIADLTPPL